MKQTLLITGGAGYIGSHTALLMAQKGYNIIILDSFAHNQTFNQPWATVIKDDCGNKDILRTIFSNHKIDAVMHFAAHIEVGRSVQEPMLFYDNNVVKTITLLQTMLEHNIKKFIFSSSCAVYGTPHTIPINESHSKSPISPYGKTKLMIEEILADLSHAHGMHYAALRYFNAAGTWPGHGLFEQHEPETHLIPLLLRASKNDTPFYVFGSSHQTSDGTCIRDFLHVWDIAHAHAQALAYLDRELPSDCFNLGTGNGVSVKEIIDVTCKLLDKKIKVIEAPIRLGDPAMLVADPSRAATMLNWQPHYSSLEHIIRTAV